MKVILAPLAFLLFITAPALAQKSHPAKSLTRNAVPQTIAYQGFLTDDAGLPIDGNVTLVFRLYTVATVGSPVWSETHNAVVVEEGLYNVALGSQTAFGTSVDFNGPLFLSITVDGTTMTPRTPLAAVPYALGLKLPFVATSQVDGTSDGVLKITNSGTGHGIYIFETGSDGLHIREAGEPSIKRASNISNGVDIEGAEGHGVFVGNADRDGIRINTTGSPSTFSTSLGSNGINIGGTSGQGVWVGRADENGLVINSAGLDGVVVEQADDDGLVILDAGGDGIVIEEVGNPSQTISSPVVVGVQINGSEDYGLFVGRADEAGIVLESVGTDGLVVVSAGDDGVVVESSGDAGVFVDQAGGQGVFVNQAGGDGIAVNGAGGYSLNIKGQDDTTDGITGHVALIENNAPTITNGPDVLALKTSDTAPDAQTNFITFYDGNTTSRGRIEGNASGNVVYLTGGSDYAEYLPHRTPGTAFKAGEVVGVFGGHISHTTQEADQVMVITDQPAVLGNAPMDEATQGFETVSFIGQVPVRVVGQVAEGDFILASGRGDGLATAVAPSAIAVTDLKRLVGRAWEASSDPGIKRVNVAVGLDHSDVLIHIISRQQQQLDALSRLVKRTLADHQSAQLTDIN